MGQQDPNGSQPLIGDVTDTALWVAVYRAQESARPDALFRDPLAAQLTGERGRAIAAGMRDGRYTQWSVVLRTRIIDDFILELVAAGVDTIINLGAGLDTRPYRLALPATLRWIEVDLPSIIAMKTRGLAGHRPVCQLEHITADLSDDTMRRALLAQLGARTQHALVITEGVVPYLSNEQAGVLAQDLRDQTAFKHWIVDYFSPEVMRFIQRRRQPQMRNAPFRFNPENWATFFEQRGWRQGQVRYLGIEGRRHGRVTPHPWWVRLLARLSPPKQRAFLDQLMAYVILEPAPR